MMCKFVIKQNDGNIISVVENDKFIEPIIKFSGQIGMGITTPKEFNKHFGEHYIAEEITNEEYLLLLIGG